MQFTQAMKRVGYSDVEIVVVETGWPSAGEPNQIGVGFDYGAAYSGNLIKNVNSGKGTPLMPTGFSRLKFFLSSTRISNLPFPSKILVF